VFRRLIRGASSLVQLSSMGSQSRPPTPASFTKGYARLKCLTSEERRNCDDLPM
jgi:hypothetical protein